jgi:hypothetical protein
MKGRDERERDKEREERKREYSDPLIICIVYTMSISYILYNIPTP